MPRKDVYASAQEALNQWNAMLRITGGALEPSKTFWCALGMSDENEDKRITVNNNEELTQITRRHAEEYFFSLGVWQSPTGKEQKQVEHIRSKIAAWTMETTERFISRYHARSAVAMTLGRTILYPLTATGMTKNECEQIQRELNKSVLGKMGIARSVAKTLANSPTVHRGYGVPDILVEQASQHVTVLQQHMTSTTVTGKLLRISLDQYTLETGRSGSPLINSVSSYMTANTWVANTIQQMQILGIQMIGNIQELGKWSSNDSFIMDLMLQHGVSDLGTINKVRMYLQVVTVSDLLQANGKLFDTGLLACVKNETNPSPSMQRYRWVTVEKPTIRERAHWHSSLLAVLGVGTDGRSMQQDDNFGWTAQAGRFSGWNFSSQSKKLYQRIDDQQWIIWVRDRCVNVRVLWHQVFRRSHVVGSLPSGVRPCSISYLLVNKVKIKAICGGQTICGQQKEDEVSILEKSWILQHQWSTDMAEEN